MHLTVTTPGDDIYTLDISEDLELENFKALLEFESSVPSGEISLLFNGNNLTDNTKTLQAYGIKDGDMLLMQRMRRQPVITRAPPQLTGMDWSSVSVPGRSNNSHSRPPQAAASHDQDDPSVIRDMFLSDSHQMALLKERNPPLAEALLSGSIERFTEILSQQRQERAGRDMKRIRQLMADPLDPNAQKEIAEEIRMSNVNLNMETAMEYTPESFGQVVMLYINCTVNGHPVKAFVDSGAQMTIMSKACAEKCNIMRLVDHRWAGIAKGVGVQKIIGRVHMAQIQIEDVYLPTSFSVLEDQPMDMLLGLDMLKRHQCCIDLKKNILHIGTTKTDTTFLPESELPECARLSVTGGGSDGGTSPRHYDNSLQELEDRELAEALTKSSEASTSTSVAAGSSASGVASSMSTGVPVVKEFPEETVQRLVQMGFSREEVIEQLKCSGGNADLAATILLAKSIKPPSGR